MRLSGLVRRIPASTLALVLAACGGGSSSSPTTGSTPSPPPPAVSSSNPCGAALAEQPQASAAQARPASKTGSLGYDVRDPREFLGLHQIARAAVATAEAAGRPAAAAVAPRSGDIALINDNGALVVGSNNFDLNGLGLRFEPNAQGGYDVVRTSADVPRRTSAGVSRSATTRPPRRRSASASASTAPRAARRS